VLQSAVDAGRPIGIFEVVSRSPLALFGMLVAGLGADHYAWDMGELDLGPAPARATYLIGYPDR
jgi:hypothetical protein